MLTNWLQELKQLSDELRSDVIFNVSKTGGHLGSSLGVVELTVALHYVFNAPQDRILWDVGHQVSISPSFFWFTQLQILWTTLRLYVKFFRYLIVHFYFDSQSYPHKILTGRRDMMHTMRQTNGLAGFTKRSESEYDCFGTGHSSTTISAGLGNYSLSTNR